MKNNNKGDDILKGWENFKAGRVKLRTWTVNRKTGERTLSYTGIDDLRKSRAAALRTLRSKELKMSQAELAQAIHVSVRTLQGWEIGRSLVPEPVMLLVKVLKKHPEIKKELVEA
ncbi:MAG: helix-turn-helix domain-containing protein [Bacteroidetes bacterium]|jgi:DNA-binding transcriptional regulator YiaG|nr:helix-turn-helix domain-containing protein [Bacteroidota bacterium]